MERNVAFNAAMARLERRCHSMITELKSAGEVYEGEDLVKAIEEVGAKYNLMNLG